MIQLKIKTEYSFGQTFAPLDRVIARLKAIGCTAAGIVDTNTWGHVPWFDACTKAGIQPMLGVEVCVSDTELATTMWFLAKDTAGLSDMYRFMSKAHQQPLKTNRGSTPRLHRFDVRQMSDHIVKFAGTVLDGYFLQDVGAFLDMSPASIVLNAAKMELSKKFCLTRVGVSDNSYAAPEDRQVFDIITSGGLKPTQQYILDALEDTDVAATIAQKCAGLVLPLAPMVRKKGNLAALCRKGIKERKFGKRWTKEYEDRLMYELDLIKSKDFESYFLIVADMCAYAKKHMLVGPSRGSAAGSLVCYLTRITEIDPIPPGLYFERFIDVTRSDLPDIDLDFPDTKREMVFDYMEKKYGAENVAHIGTISTFKPKSALIQVCKALGIPPSVTASVKVAMIERSSGDQRASKCLEDTFTTTKPGKAFIESYPNAALCSQIEGHSTHSGVHAAGLLICNSPITDYATVDEHGIAHIEKGSAERLGLLKIDVLGLRTLGMLEDSGVPIDWYNLPLNDPETIDMFNQGRMCGIFQFEGEAMRSLSTLIKFRSIVEIDAVTALARPGPFAGGVTYQYIDRMNGKPYEIIHPLVEPHMRETYGLPVYQEQTMAIVRHIGKFDWKDTSYIRKAVSKSLGVEYFRSFLPKFLKGAAENGMSEDEATKTWNMIQTMGSWQMNKAHTVSYAVISYWAAFLKVHYPLEFTATSLRNAKDEQTAVEILREMTKVGIEFVPFDIEKSKMNWSIHDGKLYGGFTVLKGIGESKATKLIEARNAGKLTAKQRETIGKATNIFSDLYPLHTKYNGLYTDPFANDVAGELCDIKSLTEQMPHGTERVFIGEIIHKNARNTNEDAEIKKRGGKVETGQLEYLDIRLRDDSGIIGARIGRKEYLAIGVPMLETVPVGAHVLVRAKFWNGIRYAFIQKWKRLDEHP
jgi:DNA polymerase III alpha subunit